MSVRRSRNGGMNRKYVYGSEVLPEDFAPSARQSRLVAATRAHHLDCVRAADALELALLHYAQRAYLHIGAGSPISSGKIVPPSANSKRPLRWVRAPVSTTFSWPNSSLSIADRAAPRSYLDEQLARAKAVVGSLATSSLPTPLAANQAVVSLFDLRDMVVDLPHAARVADVRGRNRSFNRPASGGSRQGRLLLDGRLASSPPARSSTR